MNSNVGDDRPARVRVQAAERRIASLEASVQHWQAVAAAERRPR